MENIIQLLQEALQDGGRIQNVNNKPLLRKPRLLVMFLGFVRGVGAHRV